MKSNPFRFGYLYRAQRLISDVNQYGVSERELVRPNEVWSGMSASSLLQYCIDSGWICRNQQGGLSISNSGANVLRAPNMKKGLVIQIEDLIRMHNPAWLKLSIYGVGRVANHVSLDTHQCLKEAGLLNIEDFDTISWWDAQAELVRTNHGAKLTEIGRKGEVLSIEFETKRTGQSPRWIAVEDSSAGYDVLSVVSNSDDSPLLIEVKTSTQPWDAAICTITRNEWEVLRTAEAAKVHLWLLRGKGPALCAQIDIATFEQHVPIDQGGGMWRQTKISFNALCDAPSPCTDE